MLDAVYRACVEGAERNAFFIGGAFYSYRRFAESIAAIRARIERDFAGERNIGILGHDDLETYAAIFAVWFLGKTIVPLGPSNPAERNLGIARQAELRVVLTSRAPGALASSAEGAIAFVESKAIADGAASAAVAAPVAMAAFPSFAPPRAHGAEDIAYILFTSGSTGVPKGVPITFGALEAFWGAFDALGYGLGAGDRFLQMFDLTFDLSLMSYCVPLSLGACVYTVPAEEIKHLFIYGLLEEQQITCALMVPSILAHLRAFFPEIQLPHLRCSLFCGEALHDDLVIEWMRCVPNARVVNVYGPTEATIFCLTYDCAREAAHLTSNGVVSIGRPMRDMGAIIAGEDRRPLPVGEKGELCLTGPQLTLGYWKNPEKNAAAFFEYQGRIYYRTGDLCSEDAGGDFMYAGRLDQQVKVQGFRVELGEIEHHVRQVTGLEQVAAVACSDPAGNTTIHLFLGAPRADVRVQSMLAELRARLPPYMIPSKTTSLENLPLNANGKIDRPALVRRAAEER